MVKRRYDSWKESEVKFLKNNLGKITKSKLSSALGRTVAAIDQKIRIMGLETKVRNTHIISHVEEKKKAFYKKFKNKLGEKDDRSTLQSTARSKIRSGINRQQKEDSGCVT